MNFKLKEYILNRINKTLVASGCWEWTKSKTPQGYGRSEGYKLYGKQLAHQISYIAFKGSYDKDLCVLHKCHNPKCCNPQHLYLGTRKDNNEDRSRTTRGGYKLTEQDIIKIKSLLGTMSQKKLGDMFGVAQPTISDINRGRYWKRIL